MKRKPLIWIPVFAGSLLVLGPLCSFNSDTDTSITSAQGQASSVGSPGEMGTCSRSGCHGSGSGGLADNAGPGSVTYTSVPAITGIQYAPGQVYHFTVKVAEAGKAHYGFACEILDNSGSTNGHINNTAGTITVTDATNTRTWQAFGTGRLSVTHSSAGGYSSNSASFIFDWTAPASGTVNIYLCGNATNNNAIADGPDNVYVLNQQLTPLATGIAETEPENLSILAYPVPTRDFLNISFKAREEGCLTLNLYSIDGLLVRVLDKRNYQAGPFAQAYAGGDLPKGTYILRMENGKNSHSKMIMVQ
ncbi:MAG: choice-of-anchor V domain-containing protein [Bacteroidia bacterium]